MLRHKAVSHAIPLFCSHGRRANTCAVRLFSSFLPSLKYNPRDKWTDPQLFQEYSKKTFYYNQKIRRLDEEIEKRKGITKTKRKKSHSEKEIERVHERVLLGEKMDPLEFVKLVCERCKHPVHDEDGLLLYIWDVAKVAHDLKLCDDSIFGKLVGEFSLNSKLEYAEDGFRELQLKFPDSWEKKIDLIDLDRFLGCLVRKDRFSEALNLFEVIKRKATSSKEPISPYVLHSLIRASGKHGKVDLALQFFEEAQHQLSGISSHTFCSLISACGKARQKELLTKYWDSWKKVSAERPLMRPFSENQIYSEMIKALAQCHDPTFALSILEEWETRVAIPITEKSTLPSIPIENYNTVLQCVGERDASSALDFFHRKFYSPIQIQLPTSENPIQQIVLANKSALPQLLPNQETFHILIASCCEHRSFVQAWRLLGVMEQKFLMEPTATTFNLLVRGYAKAGDMEEAFRVIIHMKKLKRIPPNLSTWRTFKKYCIKAGKWENNFEGKIERLREQWGREDKIKEDRDNERKLAELYRAKMALRAKQHEASRMRDLLRPTRRALRRRKMLLPRTRVGGDANLLEANN